MEPEMVKPRFKVDEPVYFVGIGKKMTPSAEVCTITDIQQVKGYKSEYKNKDGYLKNEQVHYIYYMYTCSTRLPLSFYAEEFFVERYIK